MIGFAESVRRALSPKTGGRPFGYALYVLAAALFAMNGVVSKTILMGGIDPARLSQLRVTVGFIVLLSIVATTRPSNLKLRKNEIPGLLAFGILGIAATQYLYFVSLKFLPVGVALLIEFTAPIMVALWFRFGMREAVRRLAWVGLALALSGLALVGRVWDGLTLSGLGVVAAFGAAVTLAAYYVLGDRLIRRPQPRDPVSLTLWGFGAATLLWCIAQPWWSFPWRSLAGDGHPKGIGGISIPMWALCVCMILLGTVVPFWLILLSLRYIRASQASVIGMTEPLLACLIAWVALGEFLTSVQILGAGIVLVGVVVTERAH